MTATPKVAIFNKQETRKELNRRTAAVVQENKPEEKNEIPEFHRVKRGETLISLARKYDVTPRHLAHVNGFKSWRTRIKIGQKLKLVANKSEERLVKNEQTKVKVINRPIIYKVTRGDNLTDIARLFDLQVSKIKKANNLRRGKILVGQKIVLPDTKKGIYTVKKGDHLTKVARELKQPLQALIKLNQLKKGLIYPGQKIIVNMD